MTKPRVTVGVPIFNSGPMLRDCLQNIRDQTFRDFQVLIFDNCSTDETPEIAKEFVQLDDRFQYIRQTENKGSGANFIDVLMAANSEYFIWRADDDRTSNDFLEKTTRLLDTNSRANLAVGSVRSHEIRRNLTRHFRFPRVQPGLGSVNVINQMFHSHASWIYGLWRTEYIQNHYLQCWSKHTQGIAYDHLVLLGAILEKSVVGDAAIEFQQFRYPRSNNVEREPTITFTESHGKHHSIEDRIAIKLNNRYLFRRLCREELYSRVHSSAERFAIGAFMNAYADKRSMSSHRKLLHLRFQKLFESVKKRIIS